MKKLPQKLNLPSLDPIMPHWGNRFTRSLGLLVLALLGWKFAGALPKQAKMVAIGAPHTSNWDFPIAMAAIFALGIRFNWLGKHTFVNGFGRRIWHALGGIPVDRRQPGGIVGEVVRRFESQEKFWLGIAPEGTRSKVARWKQGFYHIACETGMPIVPIAFNYRQKVLHIGAPIPIAQAKTAVFSQIADFYARFGSGKHPHLGGTTLAEISGE